MGLLRAPRNSVSAREPVTTPNTTAYHVGRESAATARRYTDWDSFINGEKMRERTFSRITEHLTRQIKHRESREII